MNKDEFDHWFQKNYKRLTKSLSIKYPICKKHIKEDLSDFYLFAVDKGTDKIHSMEHYLYQWIYNKYFRFHSAKRNKDFLVNNKKCQIKLEDNLNRHIIEYEPYKEEPIIHNVLNIIDNMSLDNKILYDLYYTQGLSLRKIGEMHNCPHSGIFNQINKMKNHIKQELNKNGYTSNNNRTD